MLSVVCTDCDLYSLWFTLTWFVQTAICTIYVVLIVVCTDGSLYTQICTACGLYTPRVVLTVNCPDCGDCGFHCS